MKLLSGLRNCHAIGVDSVVLHKAPNGDLARAFIAYPGCGIEELPFTERNAPNVAYHNHQHHLLEFYVLRGLLTQHALTLDPSSARQAVYGYKFSSGITGQMGADLYPHKLGCNVKYTNYRKGGYFSMTGFDIHTVSTNGMTIWKVYESNISDLPRHQSWAYSDRNDWKPSSEGLYIPMSLAELEQAEGLICRST